MANHRCKEHLKYLSEFLDEELEPRLRADLEEHIERCANCRVVVDTLNRTLLLYRAYPTQDPSAACQTRLYKRLQLDRDVPPRE